MFSFGIGTFLASFGADRGRLLQRRGDGHRAVGRPADRLGDSRHASVWTAGIVLTCVAAGVSGLGAASAVANQSQATAAAVAANQPAKSALAMAMNANGSGYAFYRGQGNAVYMRTFNGASWSAQSSVGGVIVGAPAAAIIPNGVVVAARGTDNALWLREMVKGTWGAWRSRGGTLSASPAVTGASDSRVDAFMRGTDGGLWTRTLRSGQPLTAWRSLGGQVTTAPAALSLGSGRISVYAAGTDHRVWTRSLSGGAWSAWSPIAGISTYSAPAAAANPQGNAWSVFVRGTSNALFVDTFGAGSPTGWQSLGGVLIDGPAAAGASGYGTDVAVRGTDNAVWRKQLRNGSWSALTRVWAPAAPAPPATSLLGKDWTRIPTTAKVIALTFDAGSNADGLPAIESTLRSKNVPATFFLKGAWARGFPAQANQIAAGGYLIGNHSMTHPSFTTLTDAQVTAQLQEAQQAILTTNGADSRPLFRFPNGDVNARVLSDVNKLGYLAVRWTVDTLGWKGTDGGQSVQTVISRVLGGLRPGEIVLMHVGSAPDHTTLDASALPQIIDSLRARGYSFVTLQALAG
jgi:peptidoglycan/xylan/chitin deacetylase (PgdA/CDA1 family)